MITLILALKVFLLYKSTTVIPAHFLHLLGNSTQHHVRSGKCPVVRLSLLSGVLNLRNNKKIVQNTIPTELLGRRVAGDYYIY